MRKEYLRAPGPTPVPEEVLLAMAQPIIHHRAPAFAKVLEEVRDGLKYLFQTKGEVITFAASGTGAMEASVNNILSPGDRALCVRGGKFGERWSQICSAYGIETTDMDVEWGQAVDPAAIEKALKDKPHRAVYMQASETSTGVRHPVEEIAKITRDSDTLLIVDAITAIGVFDVKPDDWGIDVVVTGSQKALMLPPGLAFAWLSERAWEAVDNSKLPRYYFDLKKEKKSILKNQSAYTHAVSLIVGLNVSLGMIRREGLENVFARHDLLARATREAATSIGLDLFAPKAPSPAVSAICAPGGIDGQDVVKTMREKYGTTIAGGQDRAKGKIFRLSHMGYCDKFDVLQTITCLEFALKDLGHKFEFGTAVGAAQQVLEGD